MTRPSASTAIAISPPPPPDLLRSPPHESSSQRHLIGRTHRTTPSVCPTPTAAAPPTTHTAMGQCVSTTESAALAPPARDTALVLMPGGDLREYPRGATAAHALGDASTNGEAAMAAKWCVCDADAVGLAEGPVPALGAADPLRAGQIYFVLPAAARRRGVRRDDVAALAVAASAALSARAAAASAAGAGRRVGSRRGAAVAPLVFAPPEEGEDAVVAFAAARQKPPPKRRPGSCSGRRLERFASDLTAIPE